MTRPGRTLLVGGTLCVVAGALPIISALGQQADLPQPLPVLIASPANSAFQGILFLAAMAVLGFGFSNGSGIAGTRRRFGWAVALYGFAWLLLSAGASLIPPGTVVFAPMIAFLVFAIGIGALLAVLRAGDASKSVRLGFAILVAGQIPSLLLNFASFEFLTLASWLWQIASITLGALCLFEHLAQAKSVKIHARQEHIQEPPR